jgi:hypothetical protein
VESDSEDGIDGGFFIEGGSDIFGTGPQLYTGAESAPVFSPGHFGVRTGSLIVTVATPAVPESSTWAMMLMGFAGLGYAGHRAGRSAIAA